MIKKHHISAFIIVVFTVLIAIIASAEFRKQKIPEALYPSKGLSSKGMLSDYFAGIKDTNGDTEVYFFDSGKPGATVFLAGGTHPNEPAGYMASVVILENLIPEKGRVIIIPRLNNSGFTCTDPMEAYPHGFTIETGTTSRRFRFGSRGANPLDQWPDPLVYVHKPSGQQYSGLESRNLNRSYPGDPDGTFTEKVAFAIIQLLKEENVDIAYDLHEAAPEIPIINAIVYHEKAEDITMYSILELEMEGLQYAPELSPKNFHGLSHREWGDYTQAYAFLMETSSPVQGRLRGKTNEELVLKGLSKNYKTAKETEALRIVYRDEGEPLEHRVGRHMSGFLAIIDSYNELNPEKQVKVSGLPDHSDLVENGIGKYLNNK